MSATVEMMKCACSDCVCVVKVDSAIKRDGRLYCSESCAGHHKDGAGCEHAGCACHG